jgi:Holliday junction DNA helicase RuvA
VIVEITGELIEQRELSVILREGGLSYEVLVPRSVLGRLEENRLSDGRIKLVTYYYHQITPAGAYPILVGFINEVERDFFLEFIKVSGIGPKAAVKAIDKPISMIAQAIDHGDVGFLKTLPGIGIQRAKEVVAKLQGKVGKFVLIQDQDKVAIKKRVDVDTGAPNWQKEALDVLLQLQYKRGEAENMIHKVLERTKEISSAEQLLNEIYKQKVQI